MDPKPTPAGTPFRLLIGHGGKGMGRSKKKQLDIGSIMRYMEIDPLKARQFLDSLQNEASANGPKKRRASERRAKND